MNKFYNPADYFLDILSPDTRSKELDQESTNRILFLSDKWTETMDLAEYSSQKPPSNKDAITIDTIPIRNKLTVTRYFRNLSVLFWRSWTELVRDKFTIGVKVSRNNEMLFISCVYSSNLISCCCFRFLFDIISCWSLVITLTLAFLSFFLFKLFILVRLLFLCPPNSTFLRLVLLFSLHV
jgi:hypothetical protein